VCGLLITTNMRTREEIESEWKYGEGTHYAETISIDENLKLVIEVLLDIRDLLQKGDA
jgi:hypothetical protein